MNNWKLSDFVKQILALYMIIIPLAIASQTSANECVLDFNVPSVWNDSNLNAGNWDEFLNDSLCATPFVRYMYSLGRRANQTRLIFLNKTEQKDCMDTLKSEEKNVFSCGIEKLTRGSPGGCSDYSVTDVVNKLGSTLKSLGENCKLLGSDGESSEACGYCLRRWEEMGALSSNNSSNDTMKIEANICRFAVLISLTSQRMYDVEWLQSIYNCLGNKNLPLADQAKDEEDYTSHKGREVLIGGAGGDYNSSSYYIDDPL
ncbi:nodulation receptor kinase-like [Forsythia ovata]|uniref:Nodulation receptor kinase-like n=1 Tax=Forsythia ovata TaxID=205694 RepID=A0ABD1XGR6_9LAMI